MAKQTSLKEVADMLAHVTAHMATKEDLDTKIDALTAIVEKGFAAVAEDMADVRRELKGDIVRVQEHVTAIEQELKLGRYEKRLAISKRKSSASPATSPTSGARREVGLPSQRALR